MNITAGRVQPEDEQGMHFVLASGTPLLNPKAAD
jgi:hypothetical protein